MISFSNNFCFCSLLHRHADAVHDRLRVPADRLDRRAGHPDVLRHRQGDSGHAVADAADVLVR